MPRRFWNADTWSFKQRPSPSGLLREAFLNGTPHVVWSPSVYRAQRWKKKTQPKDFWLTVVLRLCGCDKAEDKQKALLDCSTYSNFRRAGGKKASARDDGGGRASGWRRADAGRPLNGRAPGQEVGEEELRVPESSITCPAYQSVCEPISASLGMHQRGRKQTGRRRSLVQHQEK